MHNCNQLFHNLGLEINSLAKHVILILLHIGSIIPLDVFRFGNITIYIQKV
jgi:hypothetical protein